MALQKHLCQSRCRAKVTVDLKDRTAASRVSVEQVRTRASVEQFTDRIMRLIALQQARPQTNNPSTAPSGIAAPCCQPSLQRNAGSPPKFNGMPGRKLASRIQRIKVRHLPLSRFRLRKIDGPFLQLAVPADFVHGQKRSFLFEL